MNDQSSVVICENSHPTMPGPGPTGCASTPIILNVSEDLPPILGVGIEAKNFFCILNERRAHISESVGNLSEGDSLMHFQERLEEIEGFLNVKPSVIAHDLHPDYLSTQWAKDTNQDKLLIPVQHHHAHIASVMAEHGLETPAIGIAMDGAGLGADGTVWGCEFLIVDGCRFKRAAHLAPFPLLGGDRATTQIWRCAYALVSMSSGFETASRFIPDPYKDKRRDLEKMVQDKNLSPKCSSMGRLFDSVAAIIGIRDDVSHEGQAAMELERLACSGSEEDGEPYSFLMTEKDGILVLDPSSLILGVLEDRRMKTPKENIAFKFHMAVVDAVLSGASTLSGKMGIKTVALSGGCFQNRILRENCVAKLEASGLQVYTNENSPANDGGIALGQVWIAAKMMEEM